MQYCEKLHKRRNLSEIGKSNPKFLGIPKIHRNFGNIPNLDKIGRKIGFCKPLVLLGFRAFLEILEKK